MLGTAEHDDLVACLGASAMGDTPWTATLERLAVAFGGHTAVLNIRDEADRTIAVENHGFSAEFAAAFYASDILGKDPRMPLFYSVPKGQIYFDHALYDVAEMSRNATCREADEILGTRFQLGAMTTLPDGSTGTVAVMRTAAQGHASQESIAAFRRLAPHIEQAVALGQVIEQKAATQFILLEALARKADGIILLDRTGAVTFANDAARTMLAAGDGLAHGPQGFVADRGPETLRLGRLVRGAIGPALPFADRRGGQMPVNRRSGRNPYVLTILPAPRAEVFLTRHSIACVIHIQDLAATPLPSREAMAAVFGLSEREADLVIALIRGPGLAQAAGQAGMALNTARNHLQSIFRKSGTASQAEMIQMFGRLL
ncbi:hypothetical protein [uncultured Brevundimonas sp.]|uniref:helix-turn-helix transcriptional regulator n=1 Tax=uncultured Brevundimonas sp. TaxID=213418 RepID=UPI00263A11F9|nr:hypothetical protein [uncultured Brevundimonas sp.]